MAIRDHRHTNGSKQTALLALVLSNDVARRIRCQDPDAETRTRIAVTLVDY